MRLGDFILSNLEPILLEWEAFARGIAPGAKMDALALRDHASEILVATTRDMESSQTGPQRSAKSKGRGNDGDHGRSLNELSASHAVDRLGSGFDLLEVVSEYRALRASVLGLWRDSGPEAHERDVDDVTRFNESIDQSITNAVASYTRRVDQSRDLFLAILSHDLRNPLNSIAMSAQILPHLGSPDPEAIGVVSQIATSAEVMARMISDLLDYTRTRLGAGMPVTPAPMDAEALCRAVFDEFRHAHRTRAMEMNARGDLTGEWDADRLRQAISNLLGNAIQHGDETAGIELTLTGAESHIAIVIHNGGTPIPGELTKIFDPLVRGSSAEHPAKRRPGSIGLGLYIAREVATSHGGTLTVTSTREAGTAFTMRLPRRGARAVPSPILDEAHLRTM